MTAAVATCRAYLSLLMAIDAPRLFRVVMSQAWYMGMLREWVASVGIDQGNILEVGCGPGLLALELKSASNRVYGVDKSQRMISLARKLAARRRVQVDFIHADLTTTSLPEVMADLVIGASVINVVKDRAAFARSMARLVKPSGILSVLAPTPQLNQSSAADYARRFGLDSLGTATLLTWARSARKVRPSEMLSAFEGGEFAERASARHLDGLVASVTLTRTQRVEP